MVTFMLPTIAGLAAKYDIRPLKKYGQNFIFDESLCNKIVRFSNINHEDFIIEVGPGAGGLTRCILKCNPMKLCVIETDHRCEGVLEELQSYYPKLNILFADALQVTIKDIISLSDNNNQKISIISNLPYNIGCKLLTNWIHEIDHIKSMTLMFQKEVADRIIASPRTKSYGRLSILCQIMCDIKKCFDISPEAFYPKPKIWSSIVHLIPKMNSPRKDVLHKIEKITALAFSSRRKMLTSSLRSLDKNIDNFLQSLNINHTLRAEDLTPAQYLQIAKHI